MAKFIDKFIAGFQMGTKERLSHSVSLPRGGKDVYKKAEKWEKETAKQERKTSKRSKSR